MHGPHRRDLPVKLMIFTHLITNAPNLHTPTHTHTHHGWKTEGRGGGLEEERERKKEERAGVETGGERKRKQTLL